MQNIKEIHMAIVVYRNFIKISTFKQNSFALYYSCQLFKNKFPLTNDDTTADESV